MGAAGQLGPRRTRTLAQELNEVRGSGSISGVSATTASSECASRVPGDATLHAFGFGGSRSDRSMGGRAVRMGGLGGSSTGKTTRAAEDEDDEDDENEFFGHGELTSPRPRTVRIRKAHA